MREKNEENFPKGNIRLTDKINEKTGYCHFLFRVRLLEKFIVVLQKYCTHVNIIHIYHLR